jgi:hypothetical protein
MWAPKFAFSMLSAAGVAILLSGSLWAGEAPPPSDKAPGEKPEVAPPGPPGPAGPPPGRGMGPPGGFRQRGQPKTGPFGPPLGEPSGRPGYRGRSGGSGPRGPQRPFSPSGPPRWPHHSWDALEKNDPQMYKLLQADFELECRERELVIQYRQAPGAQRTAVKKQLTELVNEQFTVRQERRVLELKRLEEELERLRKAIEARSEVRDEMVAKRISQLLGEENELDF